MRSPAAGAERLVEAGLVMFGERGYDGASVRAIAERAGVTAGLVLHHFGGKEGLRAAVDEYVLASVTTAFAELIDVDPEADQLAIRRRGFEALFQRHPYMGRYIRRALLESTDASSKLFDQIMEVSRALFAQLRTVGLAQPTDDPDAQVLMGMLTGLLPVLLPRHIERHLGVSLRSDEGVARWTAAEYELLTRGVLVDRDRPPPKHPNSTEVSSRS
jgi:AcrR family transcriptional regulator